MVAKEKKDGGWNIYERSRKSTTKPKSIWAETAYISEQGTKALGALDLGKEFDHPKPVELVKTIGELILDDEDIVLDFFAGSGTSRRPFSNSTARTAAIGASSSCSFPNRPATRPTPPSPRSARNASAASSRS
ncbi:MAG: DNA methyltransferase [Gemmataceae bacterium]